MIYRQLQEILQKAGIKDFSITEYIEDLAGKRDTTQSGNLRFVLYEIRFKRVSAK